MESTQISLVILKPSCFYGLVEKISGQVRPEEANQRDLDQSRELLISAYQEVARSIAGKYGVEIGLQTHPFVPDEFVGTGQGGGTSAAWELVELVVDSRLPGDVLAMVAAEFIVEGAKGLVQKIRKEGITQNLNSLPNCTPHGILAMCIDHANRRFPGEMSQQAVLLHEPSKTSSNRRVTVVAIGLRERELIYTIAENLDPISIVETTAQTIRLLPVDEWRDWYVPTVKLDA